MDSSKFDKQPDQHELAKMASRADGETEVLQHLSSQNTAIINGLIEEIGFGRYQWNLFVTCGFGFMLDQMLPVAVGLVMPQITKEWDTQYPEMIIAALYAGSLVGALLCGAMVDVVGRKLVWQSSLLFVTVFAMVSAGSPSFAALCVFVGLQAVGAGGNFAIDLTVFIESLPKSKDYLLCALPLWWGIGSALGGFFAWPLITFYSCPEQSTPSTCAREDNMGWRYQYILIGGISLVAALIRIFCLRMEESPKWLVTQGKFSEAVLVLENMARQNKSSVVASVNDFHPMPQGEEGSSQKQSLLTNVAGLFKGRKQRYSTIGVIILWICIGVAYPVYTLYLPIFLENKGAMLGDGSTFQTYRDYSISSTVGIFGPILSTLLGNVPWLGRRRAMAVTAICAAAFCGGFTTVRNEAGNVAFSSMISFWQNAFYAILYSYTPEVMPTAYRGTGCGLTLAFGRIASLSAPFIATYGDLSTSVPIWVLVGVYGLIAIVAACLPFEPKHFKEEDRF
ncbi:sugar transporter [Pestalotiopsis sp. NC0098]|nr:sugar transporter [Pestalotiopsis sp. NC0098]